ncbi:unnamed protein product [Caretta caretta]
MWIPTTIVPSICPTLCLTLPPSPASMGSPPSPASPTGPSPTALPPQSTGWVPPALSLPIQSLPPSWCFSFSIRDWASTALIKGFARAVGGSAEFITGQDRTQLKVLQSLKWAMQPAVTGISLSWDLPPGMQAELLHWDPEVIFAGQRCLVYAQLRGQPQPPDIPMGGITLQYRIQNQTYKETLQFSLQPQDGDRLPVHRLAAKSLLLELEGAMGAGSEGDGRQALEASLSSGIVCSLTAYVGVDMERGQLVQGLLVRRDVLLAERAPEESPLLRLVSLQSADVWWNLDPRLAAVLGVSGTNARGRIPSEDVTPSIWATVLAMVWLHGRAVGQPDESSCWRPRLWAGCGTEQVQTRAGQTFSS